MNPRDTSGCSQNPSPITKPRRPEESKSRRPFFRSLLDVETSPYRSSYERGCQGKKILPAPLRDAGVVTYIQPHLIAHLILRGVIGLVALARRSSPR